MNDSRPLERKSGPISRRTFVQLGLGALAAWLAGCRPPAPAGTPTPEQTAAASTATQVPTPVPAPTDPVAPVATDTPLPPTDTPAPPPPTAALRPVPNRDVLMAHWPATETSRVVVARHSGVWAGSEPDPAIVLQMLDEGMRTLAGAADPPDVWRALFDPDERVLLKVNCISSGSPTQPAVAYAIVQRLQDAGLRAENILIFDRTDGELAAAGYTLNDGGPGVQCHGMRGTGTTITLSQAEVRFFQEIDTCDAIINVPIPKQHDGAGISVSMKNHYGSVDRPGLLHDHWCDPAIAELNAHPRIRDKTRLIVGAALDVSPADWNRPAHENALLLSFDPVALDTVARDILVAHLETLGRHSGALVDRALQLQTAQSLELGTADAERIDLREVTLG